MTDLPDYTPPTVWEWEQGNGGKFANINRPVAGAIEEKELPVGKHPYQLYSLATPNGVKVTVLLEELLAAGHTGAEYDAWLINIGEGDQAHVRIGCDHVESGREIRRIHPKRPKPAYRVYVLAVLADGKRTLSRRRLWSLLCLRSG